MSSSNSLHTMDLFSRFFRENQEGFPPFVYLHTRGKVVAEDILMEAMISLWENREKWEKDFNLHALPFTIIKNEPLNYLEHEQARMRAEEVINTHKQWELDLRITTLEACEPESISNTEIQRIVYKTLEQLPEQSRHTSILSRHHNTPNKKVAEQPGTSIKSVEFHITKALKLLRLELKDYLISLLF